MASPEEHSPPASGEAPSRTELEAIFAQWEAQRSSGTPSEEAALPPPEPRAVRRAVRPMQLLLTATAAVLVGWLMQSTWPEVAYWAASDTPVDLGRFDERYKRGETSLQATSNSYVTLSGLFATYEMEASKEKREEGDRTTRYFLCPLFDVVVRTEQPFLDKPVRGLVSLEIEPELAPLLVARKAFPEDLVVTFAGTGRLVRGSDVPGRLRRALRAYSAQVGREPADLWVFLDGEAPADAWPFLLMWILAPLLPLGSMTIWTVRFFAARRAAS